MQQMSEHFSQSQVESMKEAILAECPICMEPMECVADEARARVLVSVHAVHFENEGQRG